MPHYSREAAQHQFDPDSCEDHPLPLRAALEEKNVRGVREEGGREINEQETHLVHVAAKVFAGKAVTKFVDRAENHQQNPEHPDVIGAFIGKVVQRGSILLHARPITGEQVTGDDEYEERENDEARM